MKILYTNKLVLDLPKKLFVKKFVGWSELHHKDYPDCLFSPSLSFDASYQNGKSKIPKKIESEIVQNIENSVLYGKIDLRIVHDDYHLFQLEN
jgi:hypothetical protein